MPVHTRTPQRRLGAIVGLVAALGVIGTLSSREAWYSFEFRAPVITLPSLQSFTGAYARSVLTGWDLTRTGTANGVSSAAMGNIGGMPSPLVLLGMSVLAAMSAWRLRSTLISVAGVGAAWFAHRAVMTVAVAVESPLAGGQYMTRLDAMNRFDLVTMGVMALCGVLAVQIVAVRRGERAAAEEAGEPLEPTFAETLSEIHVGRMLRNLSEYSRDEHARGRSRTDA